MSELYKLRVTEAMLLKAVCDLTIETHTQKERITELETELAEHGRKEFDRGYAAGRQDMEAIVQTRSEVEAELAALKERRCETCIIGGSCKQETEAKVWEEPGEGFHCSRWAERNEKT